MNCREARNIERQVGSSETLKRSEARDHIKVCEPCREAIYLDALGVSLIRAHSSIEPGSEPGPSPFFMARLRARIESERSMSVWETAVTAARGWLLAFGGVTALLLAVSVFSLPSPTARLLAAENEVLALPADSENIVIANSESLSRDAVLMTLLAEDEENGRK
jgi:hypothetical protein